MRVLDEGRYRAEGVEGTGADPVTGKCAGLDGSHYGSGFECSAGSPPRLNDGADPAVRVKHKRVARIMRQEQTAGLRLRRRVGPAAGDGLSVPAQQRRGDTSRS